MKLDSFRAVIFDCDGVLVDSETIGLRSLQQALHEAGIERSLPFLRRFSGRSHGETLAELEADSGVPLVDTGVAERMDDCYREIVHVDGLRSCQGVPEFLGWLSDRRIPFTLASSGPRRKVLFSLQKSGIASHFTQFVCSDDVVRAKPAPDLYVTAATLLGVGTSLCLAVEDSPNGIEAAHRAGMKVVALTTTFAVDALKHADLIIDSISELTLRFAGAPRFVT